MNCCPNCKTPIAAIFGEAPATEPPLQLASTDTEAQERWILEELRRAGPVGRTTDELRAGGGYQASARIWKLRQLGAVIDTELYSGIAADNRYHARMARYRLISEPLLMEPSRPRKKQPKQAEGVSA